MRQAAFVITVALLAFGCSSEDNDDNPYAALERTQPIPAWADILLTGNLHAPAEGAPREIFAVSSSDGRVEQLTFPNAAFPNRDLARLAPVSDADRVVLLERTAEPDEPYPGESMGSAWFLDLARGVRSALSDDVVTGVDASPIASFVVFSARGANGRDDIFWRELSSTNVTIQALTQTSDADERHPRFDHSGSYLVFERITEGSPSEIWLLLTTDPGQRITRGGMGEGSLPGTSYRVGSDADPCFSPDNAWVAFRRLTSVGDGRHGDWDILVTDSDGARPPLTIASGAGFRGAPDWSTRGIVFVEQNPASGDWALVVVAPDG
ncbi:MAG: hypothetical protein JXO72_14295, partial [Vicinamibacteria bacterium]|nr:hypothetical protein [Vicinamibacteria bacterium]